MFLQTGADMPLPPKINKQLRQLIEIQAGPHRNPQPVGIIGPSTCNEACRSAAYKVASVLASAGVPIICGGRGGVMEAACHGAYDMGGVTIGILPEEDRRSANKYVTLTLPTGIGEIRNALIVRGSECVVAIGGGMGTLSEMALGVKWNKAVFTLYEEFRLPGAQAAENTDQLIEWVIEYLVRKSDASLE
ncbi:TIGR00725 family protein [Mycetohabitans sp. B8]|uniref:TIGR00725 family protein n=1 Tax=Mycetohabitans sp. B8 TaxID=2841845 RepID=UPI001F32AB78|nr:TIGR00725 family protein [Mycetohabitans sp. B8]MCG1042798.1 TIGR00725 family protein [Mycetohabitans sp. B8]